MLPIKPHLWFDCPAREAAEFYTMAFPDSKIEYTNRFPVSGGECEVAEFTIANQSFFGISSGPAALKLNPSISFMVNFDPLRETNVTKQIDELWHKLVDGGKIMMPLDRYPFSEYYGWVADKYGLNWQLMLTNPEAGVKPVIVPSMMFTGNVAGRAEEAIEFYCSIFNESKRGITARYPAGMAPDKEGSLMYSDFSIDHTWLAAMDSAHPHEFAFNEAISLLIPCETQEEIDYYWSALSADGSPGQCGRLKDKFGVSWQVASSIMFEALKTGSSEQVERITQAFGKMTKVEASALQKAFDGK